MNKRGLIIGTGVGLTLLATGVATGAIPDLSTGVITSCYDSQGNIRVIDKQAGATCPTNTTQLAWNAAGRTGPTGPRGAQGIPGPSNLHSVRTTASGTKKWASRSDIAVYDAGTGLAWIQVPGVKGVNCAMTVTPNGSGKPGLTAERYDYDYYDWFLIATFRNGVAAEIPADVNISC